MKLYWECNMGAAGDMLTASLAALLPDSAPFLDRLRALPLPGVTFELAPMVKCGVLGTHFTVKVHGEEEHSVDVPIADEHAHEHTHTHGDGTHTHSHGEHTHTHEHAHTHSHGGHALSYGEITALIAGFDLPQKVREDALAVYALLARAEGTVHGETPEQIHFHEVGTLDAVADITACCLLVDMLGVTEIEASPVHVGAGFVRCSHGILPVPAPATAVLLEGIPTYGGKVRGELCTPTGAALLRHFVTRFGDMSITYGKIGYGMGTKDFENLNCVRAYLEAESVGELRDTITELVCNLDDMTPEAVGAAVGALLSAGAADVFTSSIYMKKNRPAVMLTCLCGECDADKFTRLIFRHTTTLGIRKSRCERAVLGRSAGTVTTKYGEVRVKRSEGYGVTRVKPEYDDVARLAAENDIAFSDVLAERDDA
jgi:uncharacterized protein (TIGR00299 family) protein